MKKFFVVVIILFITAQILFILFAGSENKTETKTVIRFSSWGSRTEYGILKEVINKYEETHPEIKIEFIHVPENYFRKLHLLYASKTEPDVVFLNNTYAPMYIKAGLLEDLSVYIEEKDFYKSSLDCFRCDNKIYAIPRDISSLVLYVNKDLIKGSSSIKTLEDLKKRAKDVSNKNIYGLNYEENPLYWLYFLEYFGGGILSDNGKEIIFCNPESKKGLDFYSSMINEDKSVPQKWQKSGMTSAQMFISGNLGFYLSGRWMVPKFRETLNFDWDIIPFPVQTGSKTITDASGWAVSKSSKNKEHAVNFVKYLSSEEVSKLFTETGLITPARKNVAESEVFLNTNKKPCNSQVFLNVLSQSKPTPVNENYSKIVDETEKISNIIFSGNKKSSEILTKSIEKKLQKYCE